MSEKSIIENELLKYPSNTLNQKELDLFCLVERALKLIPAIPLLNHPL